MSDWLHRRKDGHRAAQPPHDPKRLKRRAVLVAMDGGPHGWDVLEWAAAEAAADGRPLRIVHVVDRPEPSAAFEPSTGDQVAIACAAGELLLMAATRRARAVVADLHIITQLVATARPGAAILRAGQEDALIVLGRRRDGLAIGGWFGRSVGSYIVRRTHCPVMIVGLLSDTAGPCAGSVAVVVPHPEPSAVVSVALGAAVRRGIGVTVLNVTPASTASTLAADSAGAALLVFGARCPGYLRSKALPPILRTVANSVASPVLIVNNLNLRPDQSNWRGGWRRRLAPREGVSSQTWERIFCNGFPGESLQSLRHVRRGWESQ